MDLISPTDYARHAGISKQAVFQQIAAGRIPVYSEIGQRVGPEYAGRRLVNAAEADKARGQARVRVNLDDEDPVTIETPNGGAQAATQADPTAPRGDATLTRARTASEAHRAQLLRLELDERRGRLIPVASVEQALVSAGEKIVRVVDQLPAEADDLIAACATGSPVAVRMKLKEIARRLRERIAEALVLGNGGGEGDSDEED